jgi:hypothetical protein
MRTRHRVPAVFTLYMVDVFCCALGCVILLWLASARDAQRKAAAHTEAARNLADTRLRLSSSQGEVTALQAVRRAAEQDRDRARKELQATQKQRTALARQAAEAEKRHADALRELEKAQALAARLRGELKGLRAREGELTAQATALAGRLKEAEARALDLQRQVETLAAAARNYRAQLAGLESRSGFLEKDLARRDRTLEDAGRRLRDLEEARTQLQQRLDDRGKDLAAARRTVADLEARAKALTGQLQAARGAASQRFAGVSLTGQRVLFLVDVSGSMRKRDPWTEDPLKWPSVCDVLGKLMRSLPDLKQYQVIVFADRFSYPLGRPGYWLDYDPRGSIEQTVARLKRVAPQGETNMSAAFAEAFRYRPLGLDTIYLLSDGLPNAGDVLPADADRVTEAARSASLSRYVRQTLRTWWNRPLAGRPRVRINTIGFFFDSPDLGSFLWALARENDGSFVGMSRP